LVFLDVRRCWYGFIPSKQLYAEYDVVVYFDIVVENDEVYKEYNTRRSEGWDPVCPCCEPVTTMITQRMVIFSTDADLYTNGISGYFHQDKDTQCWHFKTYPFDARCGLSDACWLSDERRRE